MLEQAFRATHISENTDKQKISKCWQKVKGLLDRTEQMKSSVMILHQLIESLVLIKQDSQWQGQVMRQIDALGDILVTAKDMHRDICLDLFQTLDVPHIRKSSWEDLWQAKYQHVRDLEETYAPDVSALITSKAVQRDVENIDVPKQLLNELRQLLMDKPVTNDPVQELVIWTHQKKKLSGKIRDTMQNVNGGSSYIMRPGVSRPRLALLVPAQSIARLTFDS